MGDKVTRENGAVSGVRPTSLTANMEVLPIAISFSARFPFAVPAPRPHTGVPLGRSPLLLHQFPNDLFRDEFPDYCLDPFRISLIRKGPECGPVESP